MRKNVFMLTSKMYEIDFKNRNGVLMLLGYLFNKWSVKKKLFNKQSTINVLKTDLLEVLPFNKNNLWLYMRELKEKKIIHVKRQDYNTNSLFIDFDEQFIKEYTDCNDCAEDKKERDKEKESVGTNIDHTVDDAVTENIKINRLGSKILSNKNSLLIFSDSNTLFLLDFLYKKWSENKSTIRVKFSEPLYCKTLVYFHNQLNELQAKNFITYTIDHDALVIDLNEYLITKFLNFLGE